MATIRGLSGVTIVAPYIGISGRSASASASASDDTSVGVIGLPGPDVFATPACRAG
ncbi:MAG: hypothetical protein VX638_12065 [Chloroflexota bacterium]|nr:hypothetical protein [Chloroflexota bacterium]